MVILMGAKQHENSDGKPVETLKAYLLDMRMRRTKADGTKESGYMPIWVPKSQAVVDDEGVWSVPSWLLEKAEEEHNCEIEVDDNADTEE